MRSPAVVLSRTRRAEAQRVRRFRTSLIVGTPTRLRRQSPTRTMSPTPGQRAGQRLTVASPARDQILAVEPSYLTAAELAHQLHEPAESAVHLPLAPCEPVKSATTLPLATASQRLRGRPGRPRTKPGGDNPGDNSELARTQVRVPVEDAGLAVLCSSRTPVAEPPAGSRVPQSVTRHDRPTDSAGRTVARPAHVG